MDLGGVWESMGGGGDNAKGLYIATTRFQVSLQFPRVITGVRWPRNLGYISR